MELRDYLAALRRNWAVWVGGTVLGVLLGVLVVAVTPPTYQASARVFVSVSPSIPNSAAFVQQRVKSYPDVVVSESVLGPVVRQLDLDESLADLRARISATNPVDTSQVEVAVNGRDPQQAAAVANAVAERLTDVVEDLETPTSGNRPVELTVTDPATAPSAPVAPVARDVVGLGLLVGLFLGLAAAVVRSRLDTAVHTADDVRCAWGGDDVEVLGQHRGRARRSALTGSAAAVLARRLEALAEQRPVRAVLVCPAPAEEGAACSLARGVATALRRRGTTAAVGGPEALELTGPGSRIHVEVADPLAAPRVWREVAERGADVVLVVPGGRVAAAELREVRAILARAGLRPLAVALVPRRRRARPAPEAPLPAAGPVAAAPRVGAPSPRTGTVGEGTAATPRR
ncbi:hypothetical protein DQ238_18390 [Geodermatophilus sp. TF02-6]|uniref:YveK family protein n=1 Tax=Geodermatophilus sp. TF02-6 TaxID=2250575 RepID=UPI000DE9C56F|nr:Wzz/FepE/Etk N-terminal domain-containing protein [Geodermatophilus sp. TF02-6]RBY75999.1 hypothetical protein DQ238_18390 [Geodermatophilus sp. TF02-6]